MASYMMHYVCGERLLKILGKNKLIDKDKNNFRLGNLVVDTLDNNKYLNNEKIKKKMITHFRNMNDIDKCCQLPDVDKFLFKYRKLISKDYSALGYMFHLYTDRVFFKNLYKYVIKCYDKDMHSIDKISETCFVKTIKNNKLYKVGDFYSGRKMGIYGDYSKTNKYLINKYHIKFDYKKLKDFSLHKFNNPGIKEINYNNMGECLDIIDKVLVDSFKRDNYKLEVFTTDYIDKFIDDVVYGFINKYGSVIN